MTPLRSTSCGAHSRVSGTPSSRRTPTIAASASASSRVCRSTDARAHPCLPRRHRPVRLQDDGTTTTQMGRGALRVRVERGARIDLITAHLKSKLLSFPNGRFSPRNEGERARYAGYALALRAAEAITLRAHATRLLDGQGRSARSSYSATSTTSRSPRPRRSCSDRPGSEFKTGGFSHARQGRRAAPLEHRPEAPRRPRVQPRLQRPPRADRPLLDQPQARVPARFRGHRHDRPALGHDRSAAATRRHGLRPRAGLRALPARPSRRRSGSACRRRSGAA